MINKRLIKSLGIISSFAILLIVTLLFSGVVGCSGGERPKIPNAHVSVVYKCDNNGRIINNDVQMIDYGGDAKEVTAIANAGYYFVNWSDGVTTATRQDKNLTKGFEVTACFAKITDGVSVKYKTSSRSGFLRQALVPVANEVEQTVQRGTDGWQIEAIAAGNTNGLTFVKWSDGVTTPVRQDKNITESFEVTAIFGFPVNYLVEGHGEINGQVRQLVVTGECSETVTAVPNKGYTFVCWSDGVKTATRQDKWVTEELNITAIFEWRDTDYFTYNYDYATGNCSEEYLTLTRGKTDGVKAVIPERDYFSFGGWFLDEKFNEPAIDIYGNSLLGEEIFNSPSRDLYAKWIVKEEYVTTYKILMVYVTAIDAELLGNDGTPVSVHYRMSEMERQFCNEITKRFSDVMNEMLEGLVKFEVDSYFTTKPVNSDSISVRTITGYSEESLSDYYVSAEYNPDIMMYGIPELNESSLLDNYRSVLTTFSLNSNKQLVTNSPGGLASGLGKYASIWLDVLNKYFSLTPTEEDWNGVLDYYWHEFAHTVENGITHYRKFHDVISFNQNTLHTGTISGSYEITKLYLLNQAPIGLEDCSGDEEKTGIPYTFWTNEICVITYFVEKTDGGGGFIFPCDVRYDENGKIIYKYDGWNPCLKLFDDGNGGIYYCQYVAKGSRSSIICALPLNDSYKFVKWSNGVTESSIILNDVQEDITLIAYFEKIE